MTELLSCTNHSSDDYEDRVEEYAHNITSTLHDFFNHRDSQYKNLNESKESVATWITANIKHLQHPDQVRKTA